MSKHDGRVTFTPLHSFDHTCLRKLAAVKGETLSTVTAYAVNQWLIENYEKHFNYHV